MDAGRNSHFFSLTSLQIGDLQSYLSRLTLFLANESNKFFILVDNRPWLTKQEARPTHLWQLMVTKSRLSPFANTRAKCRKKDFGRDKMKLMSKYNVTEKQKKINKWFSWIDMSLYRRRNLLPVKKLKDSLLLNSDLQETLYGLIVFEVSWDQIRGINYLNELQTDTSMAVEAKLMKRWEFDDIGEALHCTSSWFAGTSYERQLLQEYLDSVSFAGEVFYDAQEGTSSTDRRDVFQNTTDGVDPFQAQFFHSTSSFSHLGDELRSCSFQSPPSCGSYKRRKLMRTISFAAKTDGYHNDSYSEIVNSPSYSEASTSCSNSDNEITSAYSDASNYKDVLILFRFNDPNLPFALKRIIVSDLRLLTLLEYGLPSWVIFLQSYPVFCRIYRPWMCLLARTLYVIVSVATVLIGFYDLYKNVPVLKATASRLCGPFFEWIESWEMISRIKYLGTMLFLHNFEKALAWFLMVTHASKSLLSILTKPMVGPVTELIEYLLPLWDMCFKIINILSSIILSAMGSTCSIILKIVHIIVWPFWFTLSIIWSTVVTIIYPLLLIIWEILVVPIRLVTAIASFIMIICSHACYFLRGAWSSLGGLVELASATEVTAEAYEISIWRSLWNDLFSQVFKALRSILYGFITFFTACNRHRLSIYNHMWDLFHWVFSDNGSTRPKSNGGLLRKHGLPSQLKGDVKSDTKRPRHYKKKLA